MFYIKFALFCFVIGFIIAAVICFVIKKRKTKVDNNSRFTDDELMEIHFDCETF